MDYRIFAVMDIKKVSADSLTHTNYGEFLYEIIQ